jgi:hypothetical protein
LVWSVFFFSERAKSALGTPINSQIDKGVTSMAYNNDMDQQANNQPEVGASSEKQSRRELATKLGKFAVYAAPFTVMALNSKAGTSSGPGPSARRGAGR